MGMFDAPQGGMFSSPVGSFFGNMLSGWGDPEAQGAADASNAFHPALQAHFAGIGQQFSDWAQQQQAMDQRLQGQPLSQQALDREGLQSAMSMALSTGPGAVETPAQKIMRVNSLMARNDMDAAKQGADNFFQNHTSGQIIPAYDAQGNPLPVSPPPIRAYHGSPYDFDAFDASKIGTGEGAQAYGHGLYFAENPATAQVYRDQVLNMPVIDAANKRMSELAREMDTLRKPGTYREFTDPRGYALANEYDQLMAEKMKPGKMYEVNINADPEQFLNWDKPLHQMSPQVQEALGWTPELRSQYDATTKGVDDALLGALSDKVDPSIVDALSRRAHDLNRAVGVPRDATGAEIVKGNSIFDNPSDAYKSAALRERGIPGIRYLDQGSRASGNGTNNYVVFDPKIIDILRKYGLFAPLVGGAAVAGNQQ